jgi:hypothetical protein
MSLSTLYNSDPEADILNAQKQKTEERADEKVGVVTIETH